MKLNLHKCSALKYLMLLGTISTLLTGCFSSSGSNSLTVKHRDQSTFDEPRPDDFEHPMAR